ncbi:hypothetical protein F4824DRAFT_513107 [Ustulina deusta]|nr:hypothetical protein F4824DRAFT_513107 [Ustulina deusta]
MDAFGSIIAVVLVAVTSVSVGSFAEGKSQLSLTQRCLGIWLWRPRREYQYEVVTLGPRGGGTKDVRGVPKRHKANVSGGIRCRMRMALRSHNHNQQSYEQHTTSTVMSINGGRRNQMRNGLGSGANQVMSYDIGDDGFEWDGSASGARACYEHGDTPDSLAAHRRVATRRDCKRVSSLYRKSPIVCSILPTYTCYDDDLYARV